MTMIFDVQFIVIAIWLQVKESKRQEIEEDDNIKGNENDGK